MIATTIEQSKHLLELGLDPSTADMCYEPYMSEDGSIDITDLRLCLTPYMLNSRISFPAWSLKALLKVMPTGTELIKMQNDANEFYYEIDYMYTGYEDNDPITAAYQMVCWLLEQGFIEKGGNNANTSKS